MFDPDLGYYVRALRSGKRLIALGLIVGVVVGLLIGVFGTAGDWQAKQRLRIDKVAVSPTINDQDFVTAPLLPERKVLDEAGVVRLIADEQDLSSSIVVSPDEQAGSIEVFATSGSKRTAADELKQVIDAYSNDRKADYDSRLGALESFVSSQVKASQDSLDRLDAAIGASTPDGGVAAQSLIAQRATTATVLDAATGDLAYVTDFRSQQNGGVTAFGQPEVSQQSSLTSGVTLALVFGILGAVVAAIALLVRRTARRRIESPQDLALYSSIVSLGELANLEPAMLDKVATPRAANGAATRIVITESLVGTAGDSLRATIAAHGIPCEVRSCLHLETLDRNERLLVAVDSKLDSERSIEDLLSLVDGAVPIPVLAVIC